MDIKRIAFVSWPSAPLTESLVRQSLTALDSSIVILSEIPKVHSKFLQWATYDVMDHELTHNDRSRVLSSSYTFRKALIRKHFLSRCLHSYTVKHKDSLLKEAVPRTWDIELSYADELDEMWSDELWDLGQESGDLTKWWILKPGMSDRGMGIRLFNSKESLQQIFQEFEGTSDDESEENDTTVVTSQLRHFVIQEYLSTPLLIDPFEISINSATSERPLASLQGHKFHLRAYCVASGALTVYLYPRILALFSSVPYTRPVAVESSTDCDIGVLDLLPHLTNTSLQTYRGEDGVRLFDELVGSHVLSYSARSDTELARFSAQNLHTIEDQIAAILSETFKAALEMPVHFQPLPNAFELYGVDFLVTHNADAESSAKEETPFQVKLLEINAEPAIELTGPRLTWILGDLFESIGKVCVAPFFTGEGLGASAQDRDLHHGLKKCLEVEVRARQQDRD